MGTWRVESAGEQFLEVAGRNEILILRVLANETGDVGAERDNSEIVGAGEIERHAGKFCSEALAFEWLRHFGVGKNDAAGKAAIGDKGAKAINAGLETMSLFVAGDYLGGASPGLQAGVLFLQFHPRLLLLPRDTRKVTRLEIRAAEVRRSAGEPTEETFATTTRKLRRNPLALRQGRMSTGKSIREFRKTKG